MHSFDKTEGPVLPADAWCCYAAPSSNSASAPATTPPSCAARAFPNVMS